MKISASFLSCKKIISAIKKLSLTDVDYIHVDFQRRANMSIWRLTRTVKVKQSAGI